jgi:hypothetical protein
LRDAAGNPAPASAIGGATATVALTSAHRNVNASGSGIIAQNIQARATGEAQGLFVGFNSVDLDAQQIGPGIAFGPKVTVTDTGDNGGNGGPTIQVITQNPADVNNVVLPPSAPATAAVAREVATVAEDATAVAAQTQSPGNDPDPQKKKGKPISLARKVSRVTVLLPTSN